MNDLKTKADDLDADKLKTVPVDFKKLSDAVSQEVVKKKTVYNKLNTKVNNLENKICDGSSWIETNQYNADEQNLERKIGDVDKKAPGISALVTTTVLNAKIGEVENKI